MDIQLMQPETLGNSYPLFTPTHVVQNFGLKRIKKNTKECISLHCEGAGRDEAGLVAGTWFSAAVWVVVQAYN
jgi:hypothetical protein